MEFSKNEALRNIHVKKRDATRQKGPSLKFSRVSRQTAKTRKSDFRRQNFGESHVCKENRVQNIVFLRVYTISPIESTIQKQLARPKTEFCVRQYETNFV